MAPRSRTRFFFVMAALLWLCSTVSGAEPRLLTVTLDESQALQVTLHRLDVAFTVDGERVAYRLICTDLHLQLPLVDDPVLNGYYLKRYGPSETKNEAIPRVMKATRYGNGVAFEWTGKGKLGPLEVRYGVESDGAALAEDARYNPYPGIGLFGIVGSVEQRWFRSNYPLPKDVSPLDRIKNSDGCDLTRPNLAFRPKEGPSTSQPEFGDVTTLTVISTEDKLFPGTGYSWDLDPEDLIIEPWYHPVSETRMQAYNAVKVAWAPTR